jgi:hypothetical protein
MKQLTHTLSIWLFLAMQIQNNQNEKIGFYREHLKALIVLLGNATSKDEKEAIKFRIVEIGTKLQSELN